MDNDNQLVELKVGPVTISMPTAASAKFSVFLNLAELFGLQSNDDAKSRLQNAWCDSSYKGRIDIDPEADFVGIEASRESVVDLALVINSLAIPPYYQYISEAEIARVRRVVRSFKRPPRVQWSVGDVFAVRLADGNYGFGQVLWEQDFGVSARTRAPTCALFECRLDQPHAQLAVLSTSRALAILHVDSLSLDSGRWKVVNHFQPILDPFSGPCGQPGKVGGRSWDGLEELANAWHCMTPWNAYYCDNFLDAFLLQGVRRPTGAIMLGRLELQQLGIRRAEL